MAKFLIVGTFLLALPAAAAAQQRDIARISIMGNGVQPASLIASQSEGGPAANVYLPSGQNVRTTDQLPVVGFQFIAWAEGDSTRVAVFTLVPRPGAPADVDLRYRADLLEARPFADHRLKLGETTLLDEMRALGLQPIVLRSESLRELFAELEKRAAALNLQR
jgi:hypothetical protein